MTFFKGVALTLAKMLAFIASVAAFTSNFTSCVVILYQPEMPKKVRMMREGTNKIKNPAY